METDDPEVGFFYENGFEIAYRGKKDNGNLYRESRDCGYRPNPAEVEVKVSTTWMQDFAWTDSTSQWVH
jgi:hypothetical protein